MSSRSRPTKLYKLLDAVGLEYGPSFRGVVEARVGDGEAVGRVRPRRVEPAVYRGDPRLVDSVFHVAAALLVGAAVVDELLVPVGAGDVVSYGPAGDDVAVHVTLRAVEAAQVVVDVVLYGRDGDARLAVRGLRLRRSTAAHASTTEGLFFYSPEWRPGRLDATEAVEGPLLVVSDGGGAAAAFEDRLQRDGTPFTVVPSDADTSRAAFERVLEAMLRETGGAFGGAVFFAGGAASAAVLHLVQALSFAPTGSAPRLWLVTEGTQAVADADTVDDPHGATVWGLAKAIPFENPLARVPVRRRGRRAGRDRYGPARRDRRRDLGHRGRPPARRPLRPAPAGPAGPRPCVGPQPPRGRRLRRHRRFRRPRPARRPLARVPGRGGWCSSGDREACWRTPRSPPTSPARASRWSRPTPTSPTGSRSATALDGVRARGPIAGVVHAAGALDDGPLLDMTEDSLRSVLAPKVTGGWNVHTLTAADDLDLFVLFSSAAAILGSPGQANYCAANAFLDALSAHRRRRGLAAVTVDWGPWADVGMAAEAAVGASARRLQTAFSALEPADAFAALDAILLADADQTLVLAYDLQDLIQFYPGGIGLSYFEDLLSADVGLLRNRALAGAWAPRPDLDREYVAPRDPIERRIAAMWQTALGIDQVGVFDGFFELGGDSVIANQILVQVSRTLGVVVDPEQAFEDFTVATIAALAEAAMVEQLAAMTDGEAVMFLSPPE